MLTHVVMMSFTDPADREEARSRLVALPAQIGTIRSLQVGLDELGTPAAADLVLITTHDDADGLRAYQGHPVHQDFLAWLGPVLADRTVVDFTA